MPPPSLGAFDLLDPIGRGGMGEVWRGRHRASSRDVAVKLLTAEGLRDRACVDALLNEVRVVARLRHRGIVHVYDQGRVPTDIAPRGGEIVPAGSPWLAMELGEPGAALGTAPWPELRDALLQVLAGLAHAHAHGVLHGDLKPANLVRIRGRDGLRTALVDFGLAATQRAQPLGAQGLWGTPAYMAPEQFDGTPWTQGPWTDLYAFGCLAYTLVAGAPPFEALTVDDARVQHQLAAVAPPRARVPVPDALAGWLDRLLRKDPSDRFACAADARQALQTIEGIHVSRTSVVARARTESVVATEHPTIPMGDASVRSRAEAPAPTDPAPLPPFVSVVPGDWRTLSGPPEGDLLADAGLGLHGLRRLPFTGREEERDLLWARLTEVRRTGGTRIVVLSGPAGCGKTALAEWLATTAEEVGAAVGLHAEHNPIGGAFDGLAGMIARQLRCLGEPWESVRRDLGRRPRSLGLGTYAEANALLDVAASALARGPRASGMKVAERHAVIDRRLTRLAASRPVVVRLDDVQWGADALTWVAHAQLRSPQIPMLIVATARDDELVERPVEQTLLDEILSRPGAELVRVGPIQGAAWRTFLGDLLRLDPPLAARLEERCAGSPLFAVHLVGDWVRRDLLVPTEGGFGLRAAADDALPDALHDVWAGRVERLLAGRGAEERLAVEIAAALGNEVRVEEWVEACRLAGVATESDQFADLLGSLLAARLAVAARADIAWSFAHGMLRESVDRLARERGGMRQGRSAVAAMLRGRTGPGSAERLGRHLLELGDPEGALEPLYLGARERQRAGDYGVAAWLEGLRNAALADANVPTSDPRWGLGLDLLVSTRSSRGELRGAVVAAEELLARAETHGWTTLRVDALSGLASASSALGDAERAEAFAIRALDAARACDDARRASRALCMIAWIRSLQGRGDDADVLLEQAMKEAARAGSDLEEANAVGNRLLVALGARALDRAAALGVQALELYERLGVRRSVAEVHNNLGEVARLRGDLDMAEHHYSLARDLLNAIGSRREAFPIFNLGVVRLARGSVGDARAVFEQALTSFEALGSRRGQTACRAHLLACEAREARWEAYDARLDALIAAPEDGFGDSETTDVLRDAARFAAQVGEVARAERTLGFAARRGREGS